ncbi:MAG: NUDIX domain-containing protein, partial [Smithellaceae bacterium]
MSVRSAGILLYRFNEGKLQVMLVHSGGPFWAKKDDGAWSIPKGIYEEGENSLTAAKREFREETGQEVEGEFIDQGELKQP